MKITLEVPEHRAAFVLELLRSLPFVTLRGQVAKAAARDETARLWAALERDRLGQHETHSLPDDLLT